MPLPLRFMDRSIHLSSRCLSALALISLTPVHQCYFSTKYSRCIFHRSLFWRICFYFCFLDARFVGTALTFQGWPGSHHGFQRMHAYTAPSPSLCYRNRLMKCATASTIITWWIHSLCIWPQVVNGWNDFWGMCYLYCMGVSACIFLGISGLCWEFFPNLLNVFEDIDSILLLLLVSLFFNKCKCK